MATICKDCAHEFFNNKNDVKFNIGVITFTLVASYRSITNRPFLPLFGYMVDATGNFVPCPVVEQQAFATLFNKIITDARAASIKVVYGTANATTYEDGIYGAYTAQKVPVNAVVQPVNQRWEQLSYYVQQFWLAQNPGLTAAEVEAACRKLYKDVQENFDWRLFVAPGQYLFGDASGTAVDIDAWTAANPNFAGVSTIEIDSIG